MGMMMKRSLQEISKAVPQREEYQYGDPDKETHLFKLQPRHSVPPTQEHAGPEMAEQGDPSHHASELNVPAAEPNHEMNASYDQNLPPTHPEPVPEDVPSEEGYHEIGNLGEDQGGLHEPQGDTTNETPSLGGSPELGNEPHTEPNHETQQPHPAEPQQQPHHEPHQELRIHPEPHEGPSLPEQTDLDAHSPDEPMHEALNQDRESVTSSDAEAKEELASDFKVGMAAFGMSDLRAGMGPAKSSRVRPFQIVPAAQGSRGGRFIGIQFSGDKKSKKRGGRHDPHGYGCQCEECTDCNHNDSSCDCFEECHCEGECTCGIHDGYDDGYYDDYEDEYYDDDYGEDEYADDGEDDGDEEDNDCDDCDDDDDDDDDEDDTPPPHDPKSCKKKKCKSCKAPKNHNPETCKKKKCKWCKHKKGKKEPVHNPDTCHDKKCNKCPNKDVEDKPKSECDHSTSTVFKTRTKILKKVFTKYITTTSTTTCYQTVTDTCTVTCTDTKTVKAFSTKVMSKKKFPWFAQMFNGPGRHIPGSAATDSRLGIADKYRDPEPTDRYNHHRLVGRELASPTAQTGSEIRLVQATATGSLPSSSTADPVSQAVMQAILTPANHTTNDSPAIAQDTKSDTPTSAGGRGNSSFDTTNGSFVIVNNGSMGPTLQPAKSRSMGNSLSVQIAASFVILLVVYIAFQN